MCDLGVRIIVAEWALVSRGGSSSSMIVAGAVWGLE
jgi:hypothetical protein